MAKNKLEDFLVDLCFVEWRDLPVGLEKLGLKYSFAEDFSSIAIYGGSYPCRFSSKEDPQGRAIQISMALAGEDAFLHFPNLLFKINVRRIHELKAFKKL